MFRERFTAGNYGSCLDDEVNFIDSRNDIPHICGNGIREPGEGCDCGTPEECSDSCCNATTCSLNEGALCYSHETCCSNCEVSDLDATAGNKLQVAPNMLL